MGPTVARHREAGTEITNTTKARYTSFLHISVLLKNSVEIMVLSLHSKTTDKNALFDHPLPKSLPAFRLGRGGTSFPQAAVDAKAEYIVSQGDDWGVSYHSMSVG
jgi:hypothetical protein